MLAGLAAMMVAGCATDPGVITESARRPDPASTPTAPPTAPSAPSATDPADPTTVPPTEPSAAPTDPPAAINDTLDLGDAKQPRAYDDLVRASVEDIQLWWSEQFPALYGEPFEPISGGIYAAYPERTTPIPGCGTSQPTPYEDITRYSAFYCAQADFMVYDDGEQGALFRLADELGPSIITVVLAHEFGHAIQARAGELDRGLPTIATEQQADCFAGAWVARAVRGEAAGVTFTDAEVRTGLSAMIAVRDPIGTSQLATGGHGSAFDRVGAFQVGFVEGPTRCAGLLDDPLPLVDNSAIVPDANPGNAPYGFGDEQIGSIVVDDLNAYWPEVLSATGATLPALEVVPIGEDRVVECADPATITGAGVVYCASTQQVFFDEALAIDLYQRFGDFVIGYLFGGAWSEAAQHALGSPLSGEERILASDCLTGAWVATLIPDEAGRTPRGAWIESGDLDEAIQTALILGDEGSGDNVVGSGFEKIAAFREGVFGGFDACTERIGD
jgi:predicted metalloprotease